MYEDEVAGKLRLAGAVAALKALGVPNAEGRAEDYAGRKQKRLEELIYSGCVSAFPDAPPPRSGDSRTGLADGRRVSSKNASGMMKAIRLPSGETLLDMFTVNVPGWDLPRGKPTQRSSCSQPELKMEPASCFVAEDAPAGMQAARAGGMTALGVARRGDDAVLWAAGADVVVTSLDEVAIGDLAAGRLSRRPS